MLNRINDPTAYSAGFRYAAVRKNGGCVGYYADSASCKRNSPRGSRIVQIVNNPDSSSRRINSLMETRQQPPRHGRFKPQSIGGSKIAMLRNPISTFDARRSNAGMSEEELKQNRIILAPEGYTYPYSTKDRILESLSPGMREFYAKGSPFLPETMWPVPDVKIPVPNGMGYLPHQVAAIIAMARRSNVLLADQQGLGKTIEIIGYMNLLRPTKTLIVCPTKMITTWVREINKWSVVKRNIIVIKKDENKKNPKLRKLFQVTVDKNEDIKETEVSELGNASVLICNYNMFTQRGPAEVATGPDGELIVIKKNVKQGVKNFVAEITKKEIDLVVLDECHLLSNIDSIRAKALFGEKADPDIAGSGFIGLLNMVRNKIMATGTPLVGGTPITMFHFLHALSKESFPSEYSFSQYFGSERVSKKKEQEKKPLSNLKELSSKMRDTVMVRRLAKDVLDLPFEIRKMIDAEVTPETEAAFALQTKAYEEMGLTDEIIAKILEGTDVDEDESDVRLSDIAEALASDDLTEEEKAALVDGVDKKHDAKAKKIAGSYGSKVKYRFQEISPARIAMSRARALQFETMLAQIEKTIPEGETNGKIVVFFHHSAVIRIVLEILRRRGYDKSSYVVVDGHTKDSAADEAVRSFQKDPNVKFFFGSVQTCAAGITLTAANVVLFLELDWTPANNLQAEKRIHRIGQKANTCFYFYSVMPGSIDANVVRVIEDKTRVQRAILDELPSDDSISNYEKKFKDVKFENAKYQLTERYAIKNALIDVLDELAVGKVNKKSGQEAARYRSKKQWDSMSQNEEIIKDYSNKADLAKIGRAKIADSDYDQMASAARSLQRTSIIRDKDMDERFVTEVLPILWKVRTFVRKKSVLNQINFPVEITGRQAGLFAPERGLDTHNKSYFKLLNSATFEERMAAKRKELNAAGDKRKKQKAIELDRMADQLLGDLDINLDDDDDLLNDGGDDIDLDDDGDDEDED
jgi:hypothetical protein